MVYRAKGSKKCAAPYPYGQREASVALGLAFAGSHAGEPTGSRYPNLVIQSLTARFPPTNMRPVHRLTLCGEGSGVGP
ncbi:hypothetical protein SAE02_22460 [Skermanella aerolata]|uniref:Uncharacterized protein n=1 Tax=Skermanella aerolata TaxID=393310 RepID=A0A512DNP8_9PROT|nr:hypothetical protein SAE02_22460 [Skermanella aerolata]